MLSYYSKECYHTTVNNAIITFLDGKHISLKFSSSLSRSIFSKIYILRRNFKKILSNDKKSNDLKICTKIINLKILVIFAQQKIYNHTFWNLNITRVNLHFFESFCTRQVVCVCMPFFEYSDLSSKVVVIIQYM